MLPVSAPFHCALMTPAAAEMAEALSHVDVNEPKVPVVANVLAAAVTNPALIRSLLVDQVSGRVRWKTSVEWMTDHGVTEFWELGAGKALSGMIRHPFNRRLPPNPTGDLIHQQGPDQRGIRHRRRQNVGDKRDFRFVNVHMAQRLRHFCRRWRH